ncbi:RNA helicase [Alicyclobacillus hesperidum subsp. aegles]|uniref:ATP-dependent RNA helicase CshA n=1 Tax=Alicyclobacillus hesperidum TaxID=89784 RepID=A0AA37U1I4_9BACL|nr:DEAD/DEAH box helicase [Alicyclobacillus hesperidum]KRW91604.1 RNA helicase [Alicyclobacillus tengchongensis]GLG00631.1 RNA helicase [Alicyclobacillus hesperidum subsp. aegles]GLV12431.1 RNA helicase [Alicyclobacillus hesperidum]
MSLFEEFGLHRRVLQAIHDMGFEAPSPIQAACIPIVMEGVDVIGQAQTGTGKTAAFGIPLVEMMTPDPHVQAIVLTPTRELAIQVAGEIRKIAKYKRVRSVPIYGGQSIGHQIRALKQGVHIVIGTPGRVLDHIRRGTLQLGQVRMVVLDEADEMLDMGFIDDIEAILRETPEERQTLLFSATFPSEVKRLSGRYMRDPRHVTVNRGEVTVPRIDQICYKVLDRNKLESLCRIVDSEEIQLGIIFCRTKRGVDDLVEALLARGYMADGLHGDLSQAQRDRVMRRFRRNEIELLVATDVAARGLDVDDVTHVVNYDIPQDPESYVHRIGRTGRAGKHGLAITLVTPREYKLLKQIERETKVTMDVRDVPSLEDVAERQAEMWRNRVLDVLREGGLGQYRAILGGLVDEHDPIDIASALLKLLTSGDGTRAEGDDYDFGDTGARPGMVRFFVNIGRTARMSPADFVRAISEEAGVPGEAVGRIDMFEKFTFIEVEQDSAPFVYEALRQSRINGTRVNLEPAKPRASRR